MLSNSHTPLVLNLWTVTKWNIMVNRLDNSLATRWEELWSLSATTDFLLRHCYAAADLALFFRLQSMQSI